MLGVPAQVRAVTRVVSAGLDDDLLLVRQEQQWNSQRQQVEGVLGEEPGGYRQVELPNVAKLRRFDANRLGLKRAVRNVTIALRAFTQDFPAI